MLVIAVIVTYSANMLPQNVKAKDYTPCQKNKIYVNLIDNKG